MALVLSICIWLLLISTNPTGLYRSCFLEMVRLLKTLQHQPLIFAPIGAFLLTCIAPVILSEHVTDAAVVSPTGGVAGAILFFFLNLNPHQGRTLQQHLQDFDFIGLGLIVGGIVCVLLGFSFSETSCK